MAESEPRNHDEASRPNGSSGANTESDESGVTSPRECHETVDPETRDDVLTEYRHRCQACGRRGPQKGGLATLHVHHIERDPDGMDEHDLENLTLLCRSCHSWFHQQSTPDDSPVEITEEDQSVLLPQDIEILRYLAENGPARTGDIAAGLPSDHSVSAVRERLWVLMGLDNLVETRDRQIVDKDIETGEWGLTEQIENSARGHIPDDPQLLLQRMEDEQVRQALDRGCDRSDIIDVLGISRRTTFNKRKRACAYDFPLSAFNRGGRPTDAERSERNTAGTDTATEDDEQQRLDAVADQSAESLGRTETWGTTETTHETSSSNGSVESTDQAVNENGADDDLRVHLQQAIDALQEVNAAL
ncbi:HNH endonuclease [Natronomonas gomsonensis]|uniref:HNH endonuclease n=1 Tax=Natronomonas gomsonensis TaxID=1046043 RepID=UPI0015C1C089|nr:HNH endonuclease signature motif containing protein [Natronomonas gomsonensis]